MTIPIATVADLSQVERVRELLSERACVIVGSAPLKTPVIDVLDSEVVVAVNGGISSAPRAADLWVVSSRPQDRPGYAAIKPLHRTMLDQAKGRTVGHVLMLRGPKPKDASERDTLAALDIRKCRYNSWSVLDKPTKLHLESEMCARVHDKPCSSGILATAIALYCGGVSVRMVGFSFTPGYNYLPKQRGASWWRNHIPADRRALKSLQARYGAVLSGALLNEVAV